MIWPHLLAFPLHLPKLTRTKKMQRNLYIALGTGRERERRGDHWHSLVLLSSFRISGSRLDIPKQQAPQRTRQAPKLTTLPHTLLLGLPDESTLLYICKASICSEYSEFCKSTNTYHHHMQIPYLIDLSCPWQGQYCFVPWGRGELAVPQQPPQQKKSLP